MPSQSHSEEPRICHGFLGMTVSRLISNGQSLWKAREFLKVGILAVQGDFEAHGAMLARMGIEHRLSANHKIWMVWTP